MPTEYWLQKKAFNSWSHVTFYDTIEEAKLNFDRASVEGNGYSWRMVKVEVIEEMLLQGERPVMRAEPEQESTISPEGSWSQTSWGKPAPGQAWRPTWNDKNAVDVDLNKSSDHGMIGKVWLGNPSTKEKKRVDPSSVDAMMKDGWVRAGPRTVL